MESEIQDIYATVATADKNDAPIGVVWWARHYPGSYALTAIDYDIFDVQAINAEWLGTFFARSADLVGKHNPATPGCLLRVEHSGLENILKRADDAFKDSPANRTVDRFLFDIKSVKDHEAEKWPDSLDERAFSIRPLVDSGKVVKIATELKRFSFRSIRTNHLISQIKSHRPGDPASAGELLHAFVLGVLIGTTPRSMSFFEATAQMKRNDARKAAKATGKDVATPSKGPFGFGAYIQGKKPW